MSLVEPTRRVSAGWLTVFTTAWLGIWLAQLTPVQLLLPEQVDAARGVADGSIASEWIDSVTAFGWISGAAGVCTLIAYPLAGRLSDRSTSRFGRRRPWILVGTLLFALGLVLLGTQDTFVGMGVFWCLAAIGFCVATAAITATISDQVPVDQRGLTSGLVSAPQPVGIIIGLALVSGLAIWLGYVVCAALLVVLVLPFLLRLDDPPAEATERRRAPMQWTSDFTWTLLGRLLVNLGNALGTTLLFFFLKFGLERDDPDTDLILLTAVYAVFVIGASVVLGRWSDRLGRRKPFVLVAALVQAVAALLIALVPSFEAALIGGALLGLGYGCFLSVDQALATQVLPDPERRGEDLGVMNIATAVPQAFGALLGAAVVAASGGFTALFVLSGVAAIAGAAAVVPIKGVR